MEGIKVEYTEADLIKMKDTEKLDLLVKIALMNRADLNFQHKILCGNGKPEDGLCAKMLSASLHIKGLWMTIIGGGGIIVGVLAQHLLKG